MQARYHVPLSMYQIHNVRKYFLLSLCSCVSGDASKEENFRISTGVGSNGKSITFDLLSLSGYAFA